MRWSSFNKALGLKWEKVCNLPQCINRGLMPGLKSGITGTAAKMVHRFHQHGFIHRLLLAHHQSYSPSLPSLVCCLLPLFLSGVLAPPSFLGLSHLRSLTRPFSPASFSLFCSLSAVPLEKLPEFKKKNNQQPKIACNTAAEDALTV